MSLRSDERKWLRTEVHSQNLSGKRRKTNWILLTGAPGSGKSTLANSLKDRGWEVVPDPGREEFELMLASGLRPSEIRVNYLDFQRRIFKNFEKKFSEISCDKRVIFDYGLAESLAFMHSAGIPWEESFVKKSVEICFNHVFLLDLVPRLEDDDPIRAETLRERFVLKGLIDEVYVLLGSTPIYLPFKSLSERLNDVLRVLD